MTAPAQPMLPVALVDPVRAGAPVEVSIDAERQNVTVGVRTHEATGVVRALEFAGWTCRSRKRNGCLYWTIVVDVSGGQLPQAVVDVAAVLWENWYPVMVGGVMFGLPTITQLQTADALGSLNSSPIS